MARISIQSLDITLGHNTILRGLDLEVHDGEFLVLLGPSGCGKSTLLHGIAGLTDSCGGSVSIDGEDVTWADPKDRGIGMVFQSYALYPTMTVERNLSFGPRLAGVARQEIARRVERAAQMLHLQELLQRKPAQLSGGQRQRVAIGRALVRQARVFLFDEPLSNLDAKLRAELRRELKELHAQLGATMVYVTHDQVEAMTLATRIAVMREGRIQQIDTPQTVYQQPANRYVAAFLGSPCMNFVPGALQCQDGRLVFQGAGLALDLSHYAARTPLREGQALTLGLRPEDLQLHPQARPGSTPVAVRLVEPMGAHQVVWTQCGPLELSVLCEARLQAHAGAPLHLVADPGRISLFDPESENRL